MDAGGLFVLRRWTTASTSMAAMRSSSSGISSSTTGRAPWGFDRGLGAAAPPLVLSRSAVAAARASFFVGIGGNGLGLPPLGGAVPADGGGGAYVFDSALAPASCVVAAPTPTGGAFTRTYGLRRNSSRPLSATRSMELAGTKTGASSGGLRATIGSLEAE